MAGVQDRNTPTSANETLCLDILGKLLLAGADINATDNKLPTLLHLSRVYVARGHTRSHNHRSLVCEKLTATC